MSDVQVAIVDHGLGNLFSVKHACAQVGLSASVTSSAREIEEADAIILPGVGAFGDAMAILRQLDLIEVLRAAAVSGAPLMGICLGMQLLMSESFEFGRHEGLGIIKGDVVRFENPAAASPRWKVPQVGWNRIFKKGRAWEQTGLESVEDASCMYFVHSFYVRPVDARFIVSITRYGQVEFCSSLQRGNVFATQFHPERSGPRGLQIYRNFAAQVIRTKEVQRV